MRKSFRIKLVTIFLIEVVLCMVTITIASRFMIKPLFIYNSKANMENYSESIETAFDNNPTGLSEVLNSINISHSINAMVVDVDKNMVYSSSGIQLLTEEKEYKNYIRWIDKYKSQENEKGETYFKKIRNDGDSIKRLVCVKEFKENVYIVMTRAIKGIEQDAGIVSVFILVVGITVAIIGAITWGIATKPFTSQIKKMSLITEKMAQLNFDEKIDYSSADELGLLAKSIDSMSDELKDSINKLQTDVERRKRLIRDISHEIKTPITTIRGYTENVQLICDDNEKIGKYCSIMIDECDVIDNLVKEMLEMSRIESDDYECEFSDSSAEEMAQVFIHRIKAEYPFDDISVNFEPCPLTINRTLVERGVMNYVKNAIKYRTPDTPITVMGKRRDNWYVFCVINKGNPISDSEKKLLWDAFYKNDKSRTRDGGHGVGLAIVKRIAEIHGGKVGVESQNGENSFMLIVPC